MKTLAIILATLALAGCEHMQQAQGPVDPAVAAAIISNGYRPIYMDPNSVSQSVYRAPVQRMQSCIYQRVGNMMQRVCY